MTAQATMLRNLILAICILSAAIVAANDPVATASKGPVAAATVKPVPGKKSAKTATPHQANTIEKHLDPEGTPIPHGTKPGHKGHGVRSAKKAHPETKDVSREILPKTPRKEGQIESVPEEHAPHPKAGVMATKNPQDTAHVPPPPKGGVVATKKPQGTAPMAALPDDTKTSFHSEKTQTQTIPTNQGGTVGQIKTVSKTIKSGTKTVAHDQTDLDSTTPVGSKVNHQSGADHEVHVKLQHKSPEEPTVHVHIRHELPLHEATDLVHYFLPRGVVWTEALTAQQVATAEKITWIAANPGDRSVSTNPCRKYIEETADITSRSNELMNQVQALRFYLEDLEKGKGGHGSHGAHHKDHKQEESLFGGYFGSGTDAEGKNGKSGKTKKGSDKIPHSVSKEIESGKESDYMVAGKDQGASGGGHKIESGKESDYMVAGKDEGASGGGHKIEDEEKKDIQAKSKVIAEDTTPGADGLDDLQSIGKIDDLNASNATNSTDTVGTNGQKEWSKQNVALILLLLLLLCCCGCIIAGVVMKRAEKEDKDEKFEKGTGSRSGSDAFSVDADHADGAYHVYDKGDVSTVAESDRTLTRNSTVAESDIIGSPEMPKEEEWTGSRSETRTETMGTTITRSQGPFQFDVDEDGQDAATSKKGSLRKSQTQRVRSSIDTLDGYAGKGGKRTY